MRTGKNVPGKLLSIESHIVGELLGLKLSLLYLANMLAATNGDSRLLMSTMGGAARLHLDRARSGVVGYDVEGVMGSAEALIDFVFGMRMVNCEGKGCFN